ncbi:hypothetical protein IG631_16237 [Alternaria alternata]|nr:hypothetical protein IG631_16237 [Alternaria alternata]
MGGDDDASSRSWEGNATPGRLHLRSPSHDPHLPAMLVFSTMPGAVNTAYARHLPYRSPPTLPEP